jgi:hypothetical protein
MAGAATTPEAANRRIKFNAHRDKFWLRRERIDQYRGVSIDPDALPDDPDLLRRMLRAALLQQNELHAENDKLP